MTTKDIEKNVDAALSEELRRYEVQNQIFNRHSRTIELLFGFMGAILTYLFTQESFIVTSYPQNCFFWGGIFIIFIGAVISFWAYRQRTWYVSSDMSNLLKNKYELESYNFKLEIFKDIYEGNKMNYDLIKYRGMLSNISYFLIFVGFVAVVLSKIILI